MRPREEALLLINGACAGRRDGGQFVTSVRANHIQAHNSSTFGLAYSPDGNWLATVSRADFVIKICSSGTLDLLKTFQRAKPKP